MYIDRYLSSTGADWNTREFHSESSSPYDGLPDHEIQSQPSNYEQCRLVLAIPERRDRDAFPRLFEIYAPRLTAFGLHSGLGLATAGALAQETMLNVWRQAERFRLAEPVSHWIFSVLRSTRQDMVRRQSQRHFDTSISSVFPFDDRTAKSFCTPSVTVELCEAIAQLPTEEIEVVSRAFFKDMSEADIAADLDLSLDIIRRRMRRALTDLYSSLSRDQTSWQ